MKPLIAIALMTVAAPALAQTAPASAPAPAPAPTAAPSAAPVATSRLNLDTPIETIVADPQGKAVLAADFGGDVTANPNYEQFKAMSLNQVQPYAPDKMPAALMKKIEADLAAIK